MGWGHMRQLGTMHGHHALLRVAACPVLHSRRPVPALRCMPPVQGNRQQILDCGDDGLLVYSTLKKMRFLQPGQPSADELAQQAAALYQAIPPARLARQRGIQLEHSAAIDAYLRCGSAAVLRCAGRDQAW